MYVLLVSKSYMLSAHGSEVLSHAHLHYYSMLANTFHGTLHSFVMTMFTDTAVCGQVSCSNALQQRYCLNEMKTFY